jgi:E3 ubiquitin-protein ligase RGLG
MSCFVLLQIALLVSTHRPFSLTRASCDSDPFPQIVAIDFTKSNQWTGKRTFNGRSLHYIDKEDETKKNPYIQATEVIGKVLAQYDDDNQIPVYGFGDSTTLDRGVFP